VDDDEEGEGSDEDSDEFIYDSEEEDEEEKQYQKRKERKEASEAAPKKIIDTKGDKPIGYDIAAEVKKASKYKAVDGVKFIEYDELGLPRNDGFDYYKYITTDTNTLDTVLDATPEQMAKVMRPTGTRYDCDKEEKDMNDEEKAAMAALEAMEGEYLELEDDFLMIANEGEVAIVEIDDDEEGA